jgi:hypothetical protein
MPAAIETASRLGLNHAPDPNQPATLSQFNAVTGRNWHLVFAIAIAIAMLDWAK